MSPIAGGGPRPGPPVTGHFKVQLWELILNTLPNTGRAGPSEPLQTASLSRPEPWTRPEWPVRRLQQTPAGAGTGPPTVLAKDTGHRRGQGHCARPSRSDLKGTAGSQQAPVTNSVRPRRWDGNVDFFFPTSLPFPRSRLKMGFFQVKTFPFPPNGPLGAGGHRFVLLSAVPAGLSLFSKVTGIRLNSRKPQQTRSRLRPEQKGFHSRGSGQAARASGGGRGTGSPENPQSPNPGEVTDGPGLPGGYPTRQHPAGRQPLFFIF